MQRGRGKSSRELRRLGQRQLEREKRDAQVKAFWALTEAERARLMADNEAFQRISRNGITLEDMHKAEEEAYKNGVRAGKDATIRTCFAAICLALHELHGFGKEECSAVLNATYDKMVFALTSEEAIQEVYDTIGLTISFSGDVTEDVVQEKGA